MQESSLSALPCMDIVRAWVSRPVILHGFSRRVFMLHGFRYFRLHGFCYFRLHSLHARSLVHGFSRWFQHGRIRLSRKNGVPSIVLCMGYVVYAGDAVNCGLVPESPGNENPFSNRVGKMLYSYALLFGYTSIFRHLSFYPKYLPCFVRGQFCILIYLGRCLAGGTMRNRPPGGCGNGRYS